MSDFGYGLLGAVAGGLKTLQDEYVNINEEKKEIRKEEREEKRDLAKEERTQIRQLAFEKRQQGYIVEGEDRRTAAEKERDIRLYELRLKADKQNADYSYGLQLQEGNRLRDELVNHPEQSIPYLSNVAEGAARIKTAKDAEAAGVQLYGMGKTNPDYDEKDMQAMVFAEMLNYGAGDIQGEVFKAIKAQGNDPGRLIQKTPKEYSNEKVLRLFKDSTNRSYLKGQILESMSTSIAGEVSKINNSGKGDAGQALVDMTQQASNRTDQIIDKWDQWMTQADSRDWPQKREQAIQNVMKAEGIDRAAAVKQMKDQYTSQIQAILETTEGAKAGTGYVTVLQQKLLNRIWNGDPPVDSWWTRPVN